MKNTNPDAIEEKLEEEIYSLLDKQEEILEKLKKEDHRLLNLDTERAFLRKCNDHLQEELSDLTKIVKGLMPAGSQV
ncbi:MAG: hypothetical protein EPN39_00755 [Chitinophagaceae bacterium]|jgi:hypothetical protein|nr:MAG: hypothetical protein EPN39_00755 [Chitinophagaceae bacterium]